MKRVPMMKRLAFVALSIVLAEDTRAGSCEPTLWFSFCSAEGPTPSCPCVPVPLAAAMAGHGCPNSFTPNGARLDVIPGCFDDPTFSAVIGGNSASFALMVRGSSNEAPPVPSGDGLRCVGGQLVRFGGHNAGTNGAPLGTWTYPNQVQTVPIQVASQAPPGQGGIFQLFYRNVQPFCNSSTTNWTNAVVIHEW